MAGVFCRGNFWTNYVEKWRWSLVFFIQRLSYGCFGAGFGTALDMTGKPFLSMA
jgi:hypothetical protein